MKRGLGGVVGHVRVAAEWRRRRRWCAGAAVVVVAPAGAAADAVMGGAFGRLIGRFVELCGVVAVFGLRKQDWMFGYMFI